MDQESGRLDVYLDPSINSQCDPGQVTVPLWASDEGAELINVYSSFHSTEYCIDVSDLRHRLWHIVSTADSRVTTRHSERSLFVHILEPQTPAETQLHVHTYTEKTGLCLHWLWLKKQCQPSIICKLIVPFRVLSPPSRKLINSHSRQRMQWILI